MNLENNNENEQKIKRNRNNYNRINNNNNGIEFYLKCQPDSNSFSILELLVFIIEIFISEKKIYY